MNWLRSVPAGCLALLTLLPAGLAAGPEQWIPARWQGGPLEIERRKALKSEFAAVLRDWYRPDTLSLLKDTPINCLLATWATGADAAIEREQQRLVGDYAKRARAMGIAVLGVVYGGADVMKAGESAREAGLGGLVLEGDFPAGPGAKSLPVFRLVEGVAPRVRAVSETGAATATPTAEPWIDSNMWLVRSLRSRSAEPVWLGFSLDRTPVDDCLRSIADAAAAGGSWVVSPDDETMAGLARNDAKALAAWRRVADWLSFFEQHAEWRAFRATGPLAIVHDARSKHADMYDEYLNLVARRRIPYRIVERSALSAAAIEGLKAILAIELAPPTPEERRLLEAFMQQGGTVVAGPSWGPPGPLDQNRSFRTKPSGKGRLVTYNEDIPDPETLAQDMTGVIGRAELGVRLFNTPSVVPYVSSDASGKRLLVQLVNYASAPAEAVTVRVTGGYRTARLYSPDGASSNPEVETGGGRMQVGIRSIAVYAALLLEE